MDLRERLERLGVQKGIQHLKAPPPASPRQQGIEHVIPGASVQTEYGGFFLAEERYPLAYRHGDWPLASVLEHSGATMTMLAHDTSLQYLDFQSTIFLDTETTGLAGGTGTYVFLVGIGYFDGDDFCLRQFFMRDYDEEMAMLAELGRLLGGFRSLVSFNGRGFDWPLLETRFMLARQRPPLLGVPHLDLLHLARRLWRVRLPSCALSSLEKHILGVQRTGEDVPGWMVPDLYFRYLRYGEAHPLRQVFYHNAQDILSLVTLAAYLGQIGQDPLNSMLCHGEDFYSLARSLESSEDGTLAVAAYRRALACPLPRDVRQATVTHLAQLYRRLGQVDEAVELWRSCIGQGLIEPYVELAKHYEHTRRAYAEAEALVREALTLLRSLKTMPARERLELQQELEHRLERLQRKGAKS